MVTTRMLPVLLPHRFPVSSVFHERVPVAVPVMLLSFGRSRSNRHRTTVTTRLRLPKSRSTWLQTQCRHKDIEPSGSQVHIDMPAVSNHAAQHSRTVDLEALFTPLLAAAAPPLEEDSAVESTASHKSLETNTPNPEPTGEPVAEAMVAENIAPDQVLEQAVTPPTTANVPDQHSVESLEQLVQSLSPLPMVSASIHHDPALQLMNRLNLQTERQRSDEKETAGSSAQTAAPSSISA